MLFVVINSNLDGCLFQAGIEIAKLFLHEGETVCDTLQYQEFWTTVSAKLSNLY